jgi:hypothetical protein
MIVDYHPTSGPGARLPHVWLADGSSVYDHLGDGFTLLRVGPDAPSGDALVTAAAAAAMPLALVDITTVADTSASDRSRWPRPRITSERRG